ncbi:MAG: flagellar hook-length control protein FliK [Gallionellaceae bacterium]|nr:flagellar hook-length control protein FliK [Gallionellaceae bacterium]
MNIGALPELILSWFKNQGTEPLQAGKDQALSQFKPGAQYEGKVLDSLPNGRNLVQVGNQAMDMQLPKQARPGDVIRLTFLNAAPRPTFVLNTPAVASAQPVNVSRAAQQVNALVRYVPVSASTPVPAASVAVATTASAAFQAMAPSPSAPGSPAAATQTAATATVGSPATAATTTATTTATASAAPASAGRPIVANPAVLLAPAPSHSGTISALPGPAIPAMTMAGEAVDGLRSALGSQSSLTTAQGVVAEKAAGSHILPMRLQQTVKESGLFYESHLGKWVRGELSLESVQREPQARLLQAPGPRLDLPDLEGMPEQAARLASRQLHMLDGGPFLWQGQAWPGQMAEWSVQERDGRDADDQAAGQKWRSQLRLALPRLGEVAADLDIGALGLRIRLRSGTPEALAEINAAMPELVRRLRDAELNLSSVQAELADAG